MSSALDDAFYHQTKTPIGFLCRQGLNPESLIQPSETLPVELTGTHLESVFTVMGFVVCVL